MSADTPGAICFINPKHEFYHKKVEWLNEQFEHGLKIKLLYLEEQKKPVGFIEYIPGEHCLRTMVTSCRRIDPIISKRNKSAQPYYRWHVPGTL